MIRSVRWSAVRITYTCSCEHYVTMATDGFRTIWLCSIFTAEPKTVDERAIDLLALRNSLWSNGASVRFVLFISMESIMSNYDSWQSVALTYHAFDFASLIGHVAMACRRSVKMKMMPYFWTPKVVLQSCNHVRHRVHLITNLQWTQRFSTRRFIATIESPTSLR